MILPISYTLRNLWTRRLTTALTIAGMALVVFVFAAILMLAEGLQKTLVETGSFDNIVVIRKGAVSEVQSSVARDQAAVVETEPEIALGPEGQLLLARELVVLITLPKRVTGSPGNVVLRGIASASVTLRPQVKLVAGRRPRPGSMEMMAGISIAQRFQGGGLNETLCCGMRNWRIVGVFDAGNRGYSSEIWGDADQLMSAFRRPAYSSVIFRLRDSEGFERVKARLEQDPRLTVELKRETKYYAEQSELMAKFLRILGLTLTLIFSLGAMIGAMITMYAAVANRTGEIGTLRALGFQRRDILMAFLMESLLLGLLGGVVGLFLASFLQLITVSTMNFQTFSELAFSFTLTPKIVISSLLFALIMGFVGGVLPAMRAARMKIVDALRTG
ncbi:ABC transporter permease [Syntrophus aciditrophicus]|uniref:ABC transporter permease protein n=1 Tax=Syntrophus aciditrophicus (strain SB) TaxID=56780 RepID=Q2LQJ6_SYNAS|nr:ABC transporter permease [Syntrophus aciditrophicus]ABC75923.1 ABC transporter permease protein [Syntrophus aciditrophicus SB]OPY17122.1 MAG: Macrolide export ATP-binding/permease protein MacB [Syntrophus sp. PtaB.Bin075]